MQSIMHWTGAHRGELATIGAGATINALTAGYIATGLAEVLVCLASGPGLIFILMGVFVAAFNTTEASED